MQIMRMRNLSVVDWQNKRGAWGKSALNSVYFRHLNIALHFSSNTYSQWYDSSMKSWCKTASD